jgi:hypothetical protein
MVGSGTNPQPASLGRRPDSSVRCCLSPLAMSHRHRSPALTAGMELDQLVGFDDFDPSSGTLHRVTVRLVRIDRSVRPPKYTIRLPDGTERGTERSRLFVLRNGGGGGGGGGGGAGGAGPGGQGAAGDISRCSRRLRTWLATAVVLLLFLAASAPSQESFALHLSARRDPSALGQIQDHVGGFKSLIAKLLGGSRDGDGQRGDSLTSFHHYQVFTVATLASTGSTSRSQ